MGSEMCIRDRSQTAAGDVSDLVIGIVDVSVENDGHIAAHAAVVAAAIDPWDPAMRPQLDENVAGYFAVGGRIAGVLAAAEDAIVLWICITDDIPVNDQMGGR